jgi:hypothetical protein
MQRITRLDLLIWLPRIAFFIVAAIFLSKYLTYLIAVVPFPYDWEPTDGDHLNFSHRLAQGLAIYLPLKDGQVLSIYNPLYHGMVAIIAGEDASLSFARLLSLLFWLFIPLLVIWYFRKRWGVFFAVVAALLIWLPAEPLMLIDIVNVNPNSMMGLLFLVTLLYAINCFEKQNTAWWKWVVLGVISALCFLAKQQGLIALVVTISFLFLQRTHWRVIALTILGFIGVFALSSWYLELMNSGEYLRSTFFSLRKIMIISPLLAMYRLKEFLFAANFFSICIIYTFYIFFVSKQKLKALSIWQVSFLLHIPFLLSILGNGGGGPNYFLTMWISMVLLCIDFLKKYKTSNLTPVKAPETLVLIIAIMIYGIANRPAYIAIICWVMVFLFALMERSHQKNYRLGFFNVLLVCLFVNSYEGMTATISELNGIKLPTPALEKKMQDYYDSVAELGSGKNSFKILTHRNIGAFVANNLNIENEGCTMFSYAWHSPGVFNRNEILDSIREQRFDLIATGLQEYPEDVKLEISSHYHPALTRNVNLRYGQMGLVTVFVPNTHDQLN